MQRLAVISDLHANLEALRAVLPKIQGAETYCLGDFVDYGAEPNEVIDEIRSRGIRSIVGNHDVAALNGDTSFFNARAAMSSKWTARKLTASSVEFLRALPQEIRAKAGGAEIYLTHGSPDDRLWEYVDPRTHSDLFGHYLEKTKAQAVGLGHTHIPYVWKEGDRIVFNPGSVGQPRDGDRRASFATVTVDGSDVEVEVSRVDYDWEGAASKIREAGLPSAFADRLSAGS